MKNRIKRDIELHDEDESKINVDILRALNLDSIQKTSHDAKNNKTFLGQIKQGQVGDCWLIAALNSVIAKPKMLEALESIVTYDKKTDSYMVNFQNKKTKSYLITQKDLKEYDNLSIGSEKFRAIEIATDKLMRDMAYDNKNESLEFDEKDGTTSGLDLNGGFSREFLVLLLGPTEKEPVNIKTENFNNPKIAYNFHIDKDSKNVAKNSKGEYVNLVENHEYSIIGNNKSKIFVLNPWDSSDILTINRKDFAGLSATIEKYTLPEKYL